MDAGGTLTPMTATPALRADPWSIRPAEDRDEAALQALARACPMAGDVTICVHREPRFLALDALLGHAWQVLVAEAAGRAVGCVAWAVRDAYVNGDVRPTGYVGDLKVHPAARRSGVGAALALRVRHELRGIDPEMPVLLTALRGNLPVERLAFGGRYGALAVPYGTVRVHAIPLFARRPVPRVPRYAVREARADDVDELLALWAAVAPTRQFAVWRDRAGFEDQLDLAPGLDLSSYLVARGADGRIAAFLAIWDQHLLKRTTIVGYGKGMGLFRLGFNLVAPVLGAARLPAAGGVLRSLHAFNVCAGCPDALRAVVAEALRRHAGKGHAVLMVGLDVRDPLTAALRGLWSRPTDVEALVAVTGRLGGCPFLDGRPLHYETALV